jgi:hypothetical protein
MRRMAQKAGASHAVLMREREQKKPPRYFVSMYTDGPATRWNIIDRRTQEIVRRVEHETTAIAYAAHLNREHLR